MSNVVRELANALPIPDSGIASSPLVDLAGATKLVLFAMDQNQEISPHAAPFPAQVLVLEGRLEVMVGEAWSTLEAHGRRELPAGQTHAVRALAPSHFLLTMLRGAKAPAAGPAPAACSHDHREAKDLGVGPASPVLRQWRCEHDEALRRLDRLEAAVGAGEWAPVGEVAQWLTAELKPHNEAEEQFLFPLMDPHFEGAHGPTDCMRSEHRMIWEGTQHLQSLLAGGPPSHPQVAGELALQVASALRAHIEKENQVLYPMAERLLTPADLQQLEAAYAAR